jgi:hypothetical protein
LFDPSRLGADQPQLIASIQHRRVSARRRFVVVRSQHEP